MTYHNLHYHNFSLFILFTSFIKPRARCHKYICVPLRKSLLNSINIKLFHTSLCFMFQRGKYVFFCGFTLAYSPYFGLSPLTFDHGFYTECFFFFLFVRQEVDRRKGVILLVWWWQKKSKAIRCRKSWLSFSCLFLCILY